ncbi:MAG TPA: ABC transporter permease [Thermoanaerobaculia bacterium]|nr:ABC transporter permease [Thermoanaerobaculia bacterium]
MKSLLRDLRFALRLLAKRPALTLAAVLCLGLGIAAVTVIFSFVDAVLLRPLPVPEAERVMVVWNRFLGRDVEKFPSSGHEFEDHRNDNRAFEHLAGIIPWSYNLTTGDGEPQRIEAGRVSAALFDILGAEPAFGRTYTREEEAAQAPVAVLGHDLWQRRFGSDPAVVGRAVGLDGMPHTVVGVLDESFRFPLAPEADLWVPFTPNPAVPRQMRGVLMVGRLAPGVSQRQAQAEMDNLARRFEAGYPDLYPPEAGFGIGLVPLREEMVGEVRPLLWALMAAVALVLLIACANVANLQLAQATARAKELAIRTSLGSGRAGVIRQLLVESLVLGLAGGVLGVLLAVAGLRLLVALDLGQVSNLAEVTLDGRVLLFALAVSLLSGLLFGLAPAAKAFRPDLVGQLKEGGRTSGLGGGRHPLRSALVVAEVALALTVLVGAGLMLRSLYHLAETDPGFRTEGVVTAELVLSRNAYPGPPQVLDFSRRLAERLAAAPGLAEVALASDLPLEPRFTGGPEVEGWQPGAGDTPPLAGYQMVSPGYFRVLGIPLSEGRDFTAADRDGAAPVAVVDQQLARTYWPEGSALGKRLRLPGLGPAPEWRQVVGVVGSLDIEGFVVAPEPRVYLPFSQSPTPMVAVVATTEGDAAAAAQAVREAVWAVDSEQPVDDVRSMDRALAETIARPRLNATLFTVFAGIALLLAAVGVYGVMAYSVAQRTREIGLRMALGADRATVLAMVVRRGMVLAGAGLAAGLVLALLTGRLAARWVEDLAYGVSATDVATYLAVPLLLAGLVLVASWLPARRATRVDPQVALRHE